MLVLQSCDVIGFEEGHAAPAGMLLALSGTTDVVDGFVAIKAAETDAAVITSDPDDMLHLLSARSGPPGAEAVSVRAGRRRG